MIGRDDDDNDMGPSRPLFADETSTREREGKGGKGREGEGLREGGRTGKGWESDVSWG